MTFLTRAAVAVALVGGTAVRAEVVQAQDAFTGEFAVSTPWITLDKTCGGLLGCLGEPNEYEVSLRGSLNRERTVGAHCLLVRYSGETWAFFAAAHDQAGAALPVRVLDRQLGRRWQNTGVTETLCVELSRPYLAAMAPGSNWKVRLEGRREFVVTLPTNMFAEYAQATTGWPDVNATPRRVKLGVQFQDVPPNVLAALAPGEKAALIVRSVAPLSAAEVSGLRVGDLIVQVDGAPPVSALGFADYIQAWTRNSPGRLAVLRDGQPLQIIVTP